MLDLEFDEECSLPALENPAVSKWKVDEIVHRMEPKTVREFRQFKIDDEMRLSEMKMVYDSVADARMGNGGDWRMTETDMTDEMIIVNYIDDCEYKYRLRVDNGKVVDTELVSKIPN